MLWKNSQSYGSIGAKSSVAGTGGELISSRASSSSGPEGTSSGNGLEGEESLTYTSSDVASSKDSECSCRHPKVK